jgi:hypothetical protein
MEQNFQTSFIPKKPIVSETSNFSASSEGKSVGIFMIIGIFLFITVALAGVGMYFYKDILNKNVLQMERDLVLAKNRFEPEKINELQRLDKKLSAANEILKNHVAISPIFEKLNAITLKSIRYTKFSYEFDRTQNSRVLVSMSGVATGYRGIALQSDMFTKERYFIDPVFSNLSLDERGNVLFDLEFLVDPAFVDYKQLVDITT